jgi:hydrogenase nickel incorporation protein HypB
MVHNALHALSLQQVDILFIENVGNLVCPASFDLGHHRNVTLLSATEGDDKPAKYPVMFRAADLMLITKSDLLPVLGDFAPRTAEQHLRNLANTAPVFALSARTESGLAAWTNWLRQALIAHRARLQSGETSYPAIQPDGARWHRPDSRSRMPSQPHAHSYHPHSAKHHREA